MNDLPRYGMDGRESPTSCTSKNDEENDLFIYEDCDLENVTEEVPRPRMEENTSSVQQQQQQQQQRQQQHHQQQHVPLDHHNRPSTEDNNFTGLTPKTRPRNISTGSDNRLGRFSRTSSMPGGFKRGGSLRRSLSMIRPSVIAKTIQIKDESHSDNLSNVLSGLYAMFLVVLGASMPISKVFAVEIPIQTLEGYYLYLFLVGNLFIIFVYVVIINDVNPVRWIRGRIAERKMKMKKEKENYATSIDEKQSSPSSAAEKNLMGRHSESSLSDSNSQPIFIKCSSGGDTISTSVSSNKQLYSFSTKATSENFYLRLGAVAFGIGSVIHNGLEFGQFLELNQSQSCQFDLIIIVRPIMQLIFTFMQLYFVFINSTLQIQGHCNIARFGTMHMIATNLCVWLRVITIETVREIQKFVPDAIGDLLGHGEVIDKSHHNDHAKNHSIDPHHPQSIESQHDLHKRAAHAPHNGHHAFTSTLLPNAMATCEDNSIMSHLLNSASTYLYPCAIEYCLIAAAIMFLIWNNIDKPRSNDVFSPNRSSTQDDFRAAIFAKRNRVSVDCSGANRGLFAGILILVLTVISIIIFFIFIDSVEYVHLAVAVEHISQLILYALGLIAVILAAFRFRDMKFREKRDRQLDETLLVLSLIGVYLFHIFSSIAGNYTENRKDGSIVLAANIIITLQATAQTIFILNGLRRCARTQRQETLKPGREYVTFLLICNISIWATNTFEVLRSDANPVSMDFYGPIPWSIITHVATPLTIFHQFHATVCLSTIWKTAYKLKSN